MGYPVHVVIILTLLYILMEVINAGTLLWNEKYLSKSHKPGIFLSNIAAHKLLAL